MTGTKEEKREKMQEIMKQLEDGVAAVFTPDNYMKSALRLTIFSMEIHNGKIFRYRVRASGRIEDITEADPELLKKVQAAYEKRNNDKKSK